MKRWIAAIILALVSLGAASPALARHQDPNCTLTIHLPVLGQFKVFVNCDH